MVIRDVESEARAERALEREAERRAAWVAFAAGALVSVDMTEYSSAVAADILLAEYDKRFPR